MDIKCKLIKELDDGSAIVTIEMDEEAKEWLIGEGFITVLQEAIKISKTYISDADLKKHTAKKTPVKKVIRKKK
jgi:F0F1-type ATP synthase epsilon subunit